MRKRKLLFTLSFIAILCLSMAVVVAPRAIHAISYDVCASGCTYTTIQAAVNATSAGGTITVGPGTYNEQVNISKSLTIEGAQAGVDARTRSASESVLDGNSFTGATTGFTANGANVVIDGFTITNWTGQAISGYSSSTLVIENNIIEDSNAGIVEVGSGDTVTIKQNLFQVIEPSGQSVGGDAIYDDFGFANMTITQNTINSSVQPITIPYPVGAPGTVNITHNAIQNGSFLWDVTGSFSNNTVTGDSGASPPLPDPNHEPTFGVRLGGSTNNFTVDSNSFTDLQAFSVKVRTDSVYGYGNNTNTTISNNVVNQNVGVLESNSYSNIMDLRDMGGTSLVTGNTLNLHGSYSAGATVAYGIQLQGNNPGLTISNNVLDGDNVGGAGGGTTPPTSGVQICDAGYTTTACTESLSSTSNVTLSGNHIIRFVDGINSPALPTGAVVGGQTNCISGNSSYGAINGSGVALNIPNNWWGAVTGPYNASSNSAGEGNAVGSNITFKPFTTTPATACAGPVASNVGANPNPVVTGATTALTATVSDSTTANYPIASAQYSVDGGAYSAMSAQDGSFDQVTEAVKATAPAFSGPGTHTICVRATDAAGNIGAKTCFTLSVGVVGNGGAAAGAQPVSPQGPTGGPVASNPSSGTSSGATGTSGANGSATTATHGSSGGFPFALLVLLLILVGAAGGSLFVLRQRGLLGRFLSR